MNRYVRAWTIWAAIAVILLTVAYFASEGEPVCRGPLITGADDSDPPQCEGPVEGLLTIGPALFVAGLVGSSVVVALWTVVANRTSKRD